MNASRFRARLAELDLRLKEVWPLIKRPIQSSRTTRIALSLSLLLNVLLLGWVGSHSLNDMPQRVSLEALEQRFESRLSGEDARLFCQIFNVHRAELAARVQAYQRAQDHIRRALRAQPYDDTRFQIALAVNYQARTAVMGAMQGVLLDAAGQLSPAGRQRLYAKSSGS